MRQNVTRAGSRDAAHVAILLYDLDPPLVTDGCVSLIKKKFSRHFNSSSITSKCSFTFPKKPSHGLKIVISLRHDDGCAKSEVIKDP